MLLETLLKKEENLDNLELVGDFMFRNDDLEELKRGEFQLDCSHMTLEKHVNNECVFSGAGYIRQTKDRLLEFKLYTKHTKENRKFLNPNRSTKPGELIPDEEYYVLKAIDGLEDNGLAIGLTPVSIWEPDLFSPVTYEN